MSEVQQGGVTPTSVVSLANNHFRADHDGSPVLMSISEGKFYSLQGTGSEIWKEIEQPVRVDDLTKTLAARHNAPEEAVLTDLLRFLNELSANDLLRVE